MNEYSIGAVIASGLVIAGYIVKWTRNKTDDKIFKVIKNILGRK